MIYNSQTINSDPFPYVDREDGPGREIRQAWGDGWTEYEPRPEYDNNPNRVLLKYREFRGTGNDLARRWTKTPSTLEEIFSAALIHSGEVAHAKKVLTRLAAFGAR